MARSGLKNAARIARSISLRANPMASIWVTAPSAAVPIARAEGSLKAAASEGFCVARSAGEGVAGAGAAAAVFAAGAGAGGAAGVEAGARAAGVEGT